MVAALSNSCGVRLLIGSILSVWECRVVYREPSSAPMASSRHMLRRIRCLVALPNGEACRGKSSLCAPEQRRLRAHGTVSTTPKRFDAGASHFTPLPRIQWGSLTRPRLRCSSP